MKTISKSLLTSCLFFVLIIATQAQTSTDKFTQQFYTAYINNSKPAWNIALKQLEEQETEELQLLLAKSYYGAAGTALGNKDEDWASELLDKSAILTKEFIKKDKNNAEANALLSAVYGLKIGLSPMKGMFLGSKSNSLASNGLKLDEKSAFTNYVKATNLFYTPSAFGGDVKESLTYFEKAKSIYEKNGQIKTWEYLNTLATLGQAYHKVEDFAKAKNTYETALEIAPNFGYVKFYLLPQTEKALK